MSNENIALQRAIYAHEGLTSQEKAVALCLIWHRNTLSGKCNPSQATIARETGLSERAVRRAIKGLRDAGTITGRRTQSSACWFFNGLPACQAYPTGPIGPSEKQDKPRVKSPFREEIRTLEQAKAYGQTSR